jgi:tetratricopeptide (TPR) repeat protein
VELAPLEATPHYFYARWLGQHARAQEAIAHLKIAVANNPDYMEARYLLMQLDADAADAAGLRAEAQATLQRFPSDVIAASWLAKSAALKPAAVAQIAGAAVAPTAESLLNQSLTLYQMKDYKGCIAAAQQALKLRPTYAEAWNNIGAAYNSMGDWDKGIQASQEAIRLKPDFQLAKNNLAWAVGEKAKAAAKR